MKWLILAVLILPCCLTIWGQDTNVVYEQIALNFFTDSLVGKKAPFQECKTHFEGEVDSSITTISYEMTIRYPTDKELAKQYEIAHNSDNEFCKNNKRGTFELEIHPPVEMRKYRKKYGRKSDVVRIIVYQNKQVGQRNYVKFRTFTGDGNQGYDLYFLIDKTGTVLDWSMTSFIF